MIEIPATVAALILACAGGVSFAIGAIVGSRLQNAPLVTTFEHCAECAHRSRCDFEGGCELTHKPAHISS